MTDAIATGSSPPADAAPRRSRSLYAQAIRELLTYWSARLGLAWIFLVVTAGVFSPFIASSHPIVWNYKGHWESPMLHNITQVDVVLVVLYFAVIVLALLRHVSLLVRLAIYVGILFMVIQLAYLLVRPPMNIDYSRYWQAEHAGDAQSVVRTIIPYSPSDRMLYATEFTQNLRPSRQFLLGTTENGEDVLSRMLHACRIASAIGFISTGISLVIGVIVGAFMGYFAGWLDLIGMRLIEMFEAIPTLILLITLVAIYGRSLYMIMIIIGLTGWTGKARFVRAEFLRLRNQDFVYAAQALGLPLWSVLFRHMLPNGLTPLLISVSFGVASAILSESTLSFLGLGPVDSPSWGQMLDQARGVGTSFHWWMAVFPGVAIFMTVFAYNMVGEALRDALDPKLLKRE